MESATDAAPSAQQPAGAECPWPSTVRGTLLKRCGVHGWRPRYATLKPSAKVFRYSRAKDDAVPRFQMTLDASVSLRSRPSFKAKWPGLSSAVQVFPFVIHSALGDMHFASRSEESRSKWIDALTWSVGLPEPIAGRPGASRRTLGAPSPAGSLTPVSRSSTRLGTGGAGAGAGSHPRGSAEPRALFARPSQSDEGEDAAAGVGEGDSGADGEDAPSGPDSEGQSDDEDASADGEDDDAASSGFGPVPAEGVPAWAVRAGAQHQREAIMRCSEEGKARCWTPSGAKSGMQCFTAKGGPPGARGDGVVPWPLAAILDILQNHREDVDEQLVSQTHLATISNHYIVSQMRYKSPSVFVGPREFVTLTHWKVWGGSEAADVGIPDGTLVISASSTSIPESITSAPVTAGHTRGEVPIGGWVVRPRPPATPGAVSTVCDAVYMSTLDPKGSLPHSVVQVAVAKQAMMVKALNDALAARYGGPTWDKAPKARASGPAQQLRNDGWAPPSAASRAKRARAAGAAASGGGAARTKPSAVAPRPAASSPAPREAPGKQAANGAPSSSAASSAASSKPSGRALEADTLAATGAGRSDWLRLPAEEDPSLSRPHRINPLAFLVLLLPVLAWVLAAAAVPPHDGAPVPALPAPPAPLLDGARALLAATDEALSTAVAWSGLAPASDDEVDDAEASAAAAAAAAAAAVPVSTPAPAARDGRASAGSDETAEVLPSGATTSSGSTSSRRSRRARRRRAAAPTPDAAAAPAEPPAAPEATPPPAEPSPAPSPDAASAPAPALAFAPGAGPLPAVPGLAVLAVVVHPHLAAHVFVLACAAFALRWLYRAVVGPAWMSTRQKLSIASWNPPGEGNIHGAVQLDATRALAWLAEARAATGKHVTVTHLVIKAVGLALRACPQLNGRVVLGEFIPAGSVDVGCLVAMEREEGGVRAGDLAYTKILAADRRPVGAIADDIAGAAKRLRALKDAEFESSKGAMRALPTWALRPVSHWLGWVSSALGLPIPFIGVRAFPVGSCMVTAVGGLGLDTAFAPFTPFLHVPLLVAIGSVKDAVLPVDGAPAVRKAVTVTATVDHRVVDGAGAAVLSRVLRAVFEQPAAMLGPPATVAVK
ncbi:hypothetical protein FNF29_01433 [Cafeteria roenbergensis]|uniref:PH domain-containing protein n=1 Tax=Cafeteria roenbergensis TaxID=33653 RepID=A0A5A8CSB8_CAFRO|nr:hypothetical protein FNF29_01433 [Cafeteria roenbergensis]|eukprot:KAA0156015.1 hypothetical protein FNF29_01433 [Cafeteria roenbergensis]